VSKDVIICKDVTGLEVDVIVSEELVKVVGSVVLSPKDVSWLVMADVIAVVVASAVVLASQDMDVIADESIVKEVA